MEPHLVFVDNRVSPHLPRYDFLNILIDSNPSKDSLDFTICKNLSVLRKEVLMKNDIERQRHLYFVTNENLDSGRF